MMKMALEEFIIQNYFLCRCGHCKRMGPAYDELGRKFVGHDRVKIAKVDCTQEVNRQLCNEQNVSISYGYFLVYKILYSRRHILILERWGK